MTRLRPLLLLVVLSALRAAIEPSGLVLNIRQDQIQQAQLKVQTKDGRRDRTAKQVRVLHVDCRYLGDGPDEPATLRWFFIGKTPADGKFDYYSAGTDDVVIPRKKTLRVRIVSDPLHPTKPADSGFLSSALIAARTQPAGWVVWVCQNGQVVKQAASTPGMIDWMARNPPPTLKK